jgi:hypothetical protein
MFLAYFGLELYFNEFGALLHNAFEDDPLAKFVVQDAIAGLELLYLWFRWRRLCWLFWWRSATIVLF